MESKITIGANQLVKKYGKGPKNYHKEDDLMTNVNAMTPYEKDIEDIKAFLKHFEAMNDSEAKAFAEKSLKEMGLMDDDGNIKNDIVNGFFFGLGGS